MTALAVFLNAQCGFRQGVCVLLVEHTPVVDSHHTHAARRAMTDDKPSMSQDDIDALISEVTGNTGEKTPSGAAKKGDDKASTAHDPGAKNSPAKADLNQADIDALIEQANSSKTTKPPTTENKESDDESESISHVIDSVQESAKPNPAAGDDAGPLGQEDIDRLLAELGGNSSAPSQAEKPPTGSTNNPSVPTTSIADAARSQRPGTTSSDVKPSSTPEQEKDKNSPTEPAAPENKLVDPNATLVDSKFNKATAPTLSLSAEDLDALVDSQVGEISDHQEAPMIDQNDIDALVKQLAVATGAPDTKRISDALAKHEGEIDKLLEQAGDVPATMDAIPADAFTKGSTASNKRLSASTIAMPVMAPTELKGTRYLLAAAVVFLAMCATTLGMVVGAIKGLSHELKIQHQAQLMPTDNFADDYKAALAQLYAPDASEAAKGALFLQRLKKKHPSHEGEIALALARQYRSIGALRQASEEFAGLAEINSGHFDNPRLYLDYAACLADIGDVPAAMRQVYILLANENTYTGAKDRHGLTRPADEIARNKQALQDAYLTLGRLLGDAWKQSGSTKALASHTQPHAQSPAPAAAPAHEKTDTHAAAHTSKTGATPVAPLEAQPAAAHGGH